MPYKAKKPCGHPGCPELVSDRYCEAHRKEAHTNYNKYLRDPDTARRYGTLWRRVRTAYIRTHPLCELCEQRGRLRPAEEVHHKLPLANGGTHDRDNLQALCKSCHSSITARESAGWHGGK